MSARLKTAWKWRWAIFRALFGVGLLVWAIVKFATGNWIAGAFLMIFVIAEAAGGCSTAFSSGGSAAKSR